MENIEYKFVKIDLTQFSPIAENYRSGKSPVNVGTEFGFAYNVERRMVRCTTSLQFTQNNLVFLNAELQTFFEISEESVAGLTANGKLTIPSGLLCQFASFAYGTFRGILYLKSINTTYSDIVLPPLYVFEIIKDDMVIKLPKE